MMPRAIQSTQLCHSRTTATISPRNGTTTPIMFAMRSALVMYCRLTHIRRAFLWTWAALCNPDLSRNCDLLVERRVGRHRGEERELAPLAPQHGGPEALRVVAEQLLAERRLDDPGLLGELVLELARAPAGVAGVDARAADGVRERVGVLGVAGHEAEVVVDEHDRLRGVGPFREHDHAVGRDRP